MENEIVSWRTRLYIGAPNSTHRMSVRYVKKIHRWAASVRLQGYTVFPATGYFESKGEEAAVVEVMGHRIPKRKVQVLRTLLAQEAIYMTMERIRSTLIR